MEVIIETFFISKYPITLSQYLLKGFIIKRSGGLRLLFHLCFTQSISYSAYSLADGWEYFLSFTKYSQLHQPILSQADYHYQNFSVLCVFMEK